MFSNYMKWTKVLEKLMYSSSQIFPLMLSGIAIITKQNRSKIGTIKLFTPAYNSYTRVS